MGILVLTQPDPEAKQQTADLVASTYLAISAATSGQPLTVVEAAMAMSLTLLGEHRGLTGADLRDWIDTIARAAKLATRTRGPNRTR